MAARDEAAALLRKAAAMIEKADAMLNTRHKQCGECGMVIYADRKDMRLHQRLRDLPEKLDGIGDELDGAADGRRR